MLRLFIYNPFVVCPFQDKFDHKCLKLHLFAENIPTNNILTKNIISIFVGEHYSKSRRLKTKQPHPKQNKRSQTKAKPTQN